MPKKLTITTLVLLVSCLIGHAQLPNLSKIFDRNQTFLISKSDNKGRPIYSFVTNEEYDTLKANFLKAMGEDWKEIKRFDAGHKTGPTGKERQDKSALIGDIRLANPKQPKNHLILAVFNTPNASYQTKYAMMILVDEAPPKQD
jgi:hypothetical protein